MKKIRIVINAVVEYEIDPELYPGCDTEEQMLAIDLVGAKDDPLMVMDDPTAEWTIAGEIVA